VLAEIGQFSLILAFAAAIFQSAVPLVGAARGEPALMAFGRTAAIVQGVLIAVAFGCLMASFARLDFSVALVAEHSHSTQPLAYRLGATWGNHEGSMLLWVLILGTFGAFLALFGRDMRETLQARVLSVQAMIGTLFLAFLLFTSNPFARLSPAPLDGQELNPLLQDPGLILHPPCLYIGYVGFSVAFAFAAAALIEGRADAAWARWIRPWVLVSWIALTIGITMGSIWAYNVLGWGGWWAWDPVENASFMPWLAGTALLHCVSVLERRGALISWTLLLAILTFTLSLIGTFLVRSGVLTSVHAFAVDPARGVFVLAMLVGMTGAALALFAWRAPSLRSGAMFGTVSRESGLVANNVLLTAATATVFLGTFYPVLMEAVSSGNDKISVGPPYYAITFAPIMAVLLLVLTAGPLLQWRRDRFEELWQRMRTPALAGAVALGAGVLVFGVRYVVTALGFGLAVWCIGGAGAVLWRRWRLGQAEDATVLRLIRTTPNSVWGLVLAHAGLGVFAAGVTAMGAFSADKVLSMRPGDQAVIGPATVRLDEVRDGRGPNYQALVARFSLIEGDQARFMTSERRAFPVAGSQTTVAAVENGFFGNVYISVGEPTKLSDGRDALVVRMYWHPLVTWIWAGAFLMAAGGMTSLSDRRYRLGAPAAEARRRAAVPPQAPPGEGGRPNAGGGAPGGMPPIAVPAE